MQNHNDISEGEAQYVICLSTIESFGRGIQHDASIL